MTLCVTNGRHSYSKTLTLAKLKVLVVFLLFLSFNATGQGNLQGKWYMFSRNRIIEFNVSKDSLITKQLNWDLSNRESSELETQIITHFTKANENVYLYLKKLDDTTSQIRLNTFKVVHPGEEIIIVLNGTEKLFTNIDSIRQYIKNDLEQKYGLTLYSEIEIQRLKKLTRVAEMTIDDFKKYADKVIRFRAELDSLSKLPNAPSGLMYYGYSTLRVFLGQLGYNPLATNKEYDDFVKQFQSNPATKGIVAKLFE
jgi:hypothetical protein